MKNYLFVILSLLAIGCSYNETIKIKAFIFERRILNDGKLMVYYVFNSGNKLVRDSSVVDNRIFPQDSVTVEFSYANPSQKRIETQ